MNNGWRLPTVQSNAVNIVVLSETLIVHHPNRLGKRPKRKLDPPM